MESRKEIYQICAVSWLGIGVGVFALFIMNFFDINIEDLPIRKMPCLLYAIFGIYCPGCGGTRSVLALLKGNILQSFYYHPIVLYTVVMYGWYLISNTIQWISKEKIKIGTSFHSWYGVAAIVILVVNWIVRNLLLYGWQVSI